jgi:hypothetical protein
MLVPTWVRTHAGTLRMPALDAAWSGGQTALPACRTLHCNRANLLSACR